MVEAKEYGPQSTPEEVAALRERVRLHQEGIILFEEVPVMCEFQIDVCYDEIERLLRAHPGSSLIIDLRVAPRPDAHLREYLRGRFQRMRGHIKHVAVFTGKNFLVNVAAKFILTGVMDSLSVHRTLAEAEEAIRHAAE